MIHLHWLYFKGPKALDNLTSGASLCGKFGLGREVIVTQVEEAACPRCLELAGARSAQP